MQRLKTFKLIISIAGLLFVARPFLGFAAISKQIKSQQAHSILAKSFTKRKPESLQEADAKVNALHQLLSNPLAVPLSSISFLLFTLFPFVFKNIAVITGRFLADIRNALSPPGDTCILTGQLLI